MGGINHLYAILDLLELALDDPRTQYIHIISGQDIPIRSREDFRFFDNCNKIFIESENLDSKPYYFKKRIKQGTMFSNVDSRKICVKILNRFYGLLRSPFVSTVDFSNIWIGLVWCSFPRDAGEFVESYVYKGKLKSWKHILIPEEFFFQTLFQNSNLNNNICKNTNWMINPNMRTSWWTLSLVSGMSGVSAFFVNYNGSMGGSNIDFFSNEIRPATYLSSNIKIIEGDGSQSNPFIIEEEI